ncbi:hypothetical protein SAMN05216520_10467 [Kandleria vitulina]|uniref:hypothetical protein n=1 Tax=Kandleria vitulina TaxID=1630 RepID=UPI0004903BFB|nr:hypothetical protein [Kandleria vitulina]SDL34755.1 hypothetical protein SAMN05216520_10467 [Kandleria vitulina]
MFNELVVALITGIIIFTYSLVIRSLRLRGLSAFIVTVVFMLFIMLILFIIILGDLYINGIFV